MAWPDAVARLRARQRMLGASGAGDGGRPPRTEPCSRCGGRGTIEIRTAAGNTSTATCPRCKGSGVEPRG